MLASEQLISHYWLQYDNIIESFSKRVWLMGSVTNVLNQGSLATALADKELQSLLYQELKIIARSKLRSQSPGISNTTSLVHEAFIKLTKNTTNRQWSNRHHFFSTAAITMRHILIDQARKHLTDKRGSGSKDTSWHEHKSNLIQECSELVELNEALEHLERIDPAAVDLINLKYFVGLSMPEVSEIMQVPIRTLERQWQKAKVMLKLWLTDSSGSL